MLRYRRTVSLLLLLLPRLLLLVVVGALAIGSGGQFGWDTLIQHQATLLQEVAAHPFVAPALFMIAYIVTTALSLPNASVLTVAGGFLFGTAVGGTLTVAGATIGASLLLLVARSTLGVSLLDRVGSVAHALRGRLQRDGFSYLLALRLIPLVPFWAVNLAAAAVGVRLRVFVPATLLGITPASFLLSSIGTGVGDVLAEGHRPDLSVLFAPKVVLPLLCLAVLSLLPALLRRRAAFHAG